MCFAVTVEHEYDERNNILDNFETDNCSDQRDEEKVLDVEKSQEFCATLCMHDNGDDKLSTVVDFHVCR